MGMSRRCCICQLDNGVFARMAQNKGVPSDIEHLQHSVMVPGNILWSFSGVQYQRDKNFLQPYSWSLVWIVALCKILFSYMCQKCNGTGNICHCMSFRTVILNLLLQALHTYHLTLQNFQHIWHPIKTKKSFQQLGIRKSYGHGQLCCFCRN